MLTRTLAMAFGASLAGAVRQRHRLPLLLCLESAVIVCFVSLVLWPEMLFAAVLLRVGAVEGAVGLGCLVGLVRAHGRELIAL